MLFAYRKWGDIYTVYELHTYDTDTKDYKRKDLGTARKVGYEWIGKTRTGQTFKAKTRKAVSELMLKEIEKNEANRIN